MNTSIDSQSKRMQSLWIIAMVNSGIWAISIIALIFVIQHSPGAKGLFPILAGGVAASTALISTISKHR